MTIKECVKCKSTDKLVYCFVKTDLENPCISARVYLCYTCWELKEKTEQKGELFL